MDPRIPSSSPSFNLKVCTHNVKGLNSPQKRTLAFTQYAKQHIDVLLLQETHFSKSSHPKYISKHYPQIFLANSLNKTKGVAICIAKNVKFQLHQKHIDQDGRYIIITGLLQNQMTTLATVYAPNTSKKIFFQSFFTKLSETSEGRVIIGGDFNTTISNNLDRSREILDTPAQSEHNRDSKYLTKHLAAALVDIWREKHPLDRDYSYYSSAHNSYSRIDFIFTKPIHLEFIQTAKIHDITWSDHAMVEIIWEKWDTIRGHGQWRLNESLLLDNDTRTEVTSSIKEYFDTNNKNDTSLAIRWDAHKAVIRGILLKHASRLKKIREGTIQDLSNRLHKLATTHKKTPHHKAPGKYKTQDPS
uniref:exodeoxyribonuclease III n=1 Tax=Xenopus tropicalis TaxID=8364 RepID=A0A803JPF9_XENTR